MAEQIVPRRTLLRLIEAFPDRSLAIRELFLRNERFREICEDYALAGDTLDQFEALPDASQRPEPADYRTIMSELEAEIEGLLSEHPKQPSSLGKASGNQRRQQ